MIAACLTPILFAACEGTAHLVRATTHSGAFGTSDGPAIVAPSPTEATELAVPGGTTVVDLAVMPTGPEAALLLRAAAGHGRIAFWNAGDRSMTSVAELPAGFAPRAIATHPSRPELFVSGTTGPKSQILAVTRRNGTWQSAVVHESAREIGRLIVAPRPFAVDSIRYRLFFAEKLSGAASSLRSVSDAGSVEYQVVGPKGSSVALNGTDEQPKEVTVPSGVPMSFHPRGEPLLWQDERGCTHLLPYADKNWGGDQQLSSVPCDGWTTITPNGAAYLHWKSGEPGVAVIRNGGKTIARQATGYTFLAAPVSTPDG
ncbi:MAG: hypothetical protein ACREPM_17240, partial [Gemmatimonadaceae bacterium]